MSTMSHPRPGPSDRPAIQNPHMPLAVIGEFALGIGVVQQHAEPGAVARGCVFEHRKIPVRVSAGKDRTLADPAVDPDGFAFLVIHEINASRLRDPAVRIAGGPAAADHLL